MGAAFMMRIRRFASFLRWRVVLVRHLTMLRDMRWNQLFTPPPVRTSRVTEIEQTGYHVPAPISPAVIESVRGIYAPRVASVARKRHGHPFVNLFTPDDIDPDNPVFRLAFSPDILDVAADYFRGKLILDSIQVLYSYSTGGEIRESQYWHLDYGDRKSFHAVAYVDDVISDDGGPFVFADKLTSDKVGRSLFVRRISDRQFAKESGGDEVHRFFGKAGAMVFVDPSACYHYGSRCKSSRMAIFVTFSTWFPFAQPIDLVGRNKGRIFAAAQQVRPDLSETFLRALLQM